jgi:hypothetical protein
MILTARPVDAVRAERFGLINYALPVAELEAFTLGLARQIAANAPLSVAVMKEQLRILCGAHPMSPQGFERVQGLRRVVYDSRDYQEGRASAPSRKSAGRCSPASNHVAKGAMLGLLGDCECTDLQLETLTICIPMRLQRRGGRKLIMAPEGAAMPKPHRHETLVKALVRAHRWRRKIESGQARSITDLAAQEGVTDAYVCRLLPLTCLAPDIVEAILDGRQPKGLRLVEILGNGPLTWEEQRGARGFSRNSASRA